MTMQSTIDEARRRIIEADERGEKADWQDVFTLVKDDRILSQCVAVVMETMLTHVENTPELAAHAAEREDADPFILTPSRARLAVLRALDAGADPGPACGQWMTVDRAAEALFKVMFHALTAPDTTLHLDTMGQVMAA